MFFVCVEMWKNSFSRKVPRISIGGKYTQPTHATFSSSDYIHQSMRFRDPVRVYIDRQSWPNLLTHRHMYVHRPTAYAQEFA